MVNRGVRIWSSTAVSLSWCSTCPVAVANPTRFSTATKFLRRALQAPQMHNAQMSPEQAWQYTLHSLKATMHSIAKQADVPEHHRAEQGHHCQHGGRASVRLQSRDDLWRAPACQQLVVQRDAEGFRPLTAHRRETETQIFLAEPTVEIDPLIILMEVVRNAFDIADPTDDSHGGARRSPP